MRQWTASDITRDFGSRIVGFEASMLRDPDVRRDLQELFDRRSVLIFHNLDISHEEQVDLTLMLSGDESPVARAKATGRGDHWYVSNERPNAAAPFGRLQFHSDMMWSDHICEAISLYGVDVEEPSTPTTFASAIGAWSALPDELRERAGRFHALHTAGAIRRGDVADVLVSSVEDPPSTTKLLGMAHPRTGETILYACEQMTREVVGLPPEESEVLLQELFAVLYNPASLLHHEWHTGDLVVWDNLALQHGRPNVLAEGPRRTLRKVASFTPALAEEQRPVHSTVK
jgi:alpha-ketoglutarate-dependent taurine dioxygenase